MFENEPEHELACAVLMRAVLDARGEDVGSGHSVRYSAARLQADALNALETGEAIALWCEAANLDRDLLLAGLRQHMPLRAELTRRRQHRFPRPSQAARRRRHA